MPSFGSAVGDDTFVGWTHSNPFPSSPGSILAARGISLTGTGDLSVGIRNCGRHRDSGADHGENRQQVTSKETHLIYHLHSMRRRAQNLISLLQFELSL
jgi:hypothetical protein